MQAERSRAPGRLRRLQEELAEEVPEVFAQLHDLDAVIDELDYALRPRVHENRVPTYGSVVAPATEP